MRQNVRLHVYLALPRLRGGGGRFMYVLCTDGLTTWAMGSSNALQPDRGGNGHIFHILLPFNYYFLPIPLKALTCGPEIDNVLL